MDSATPKFQKWIIPLFSSRLDVFLSSFGVDDPSCYPYRDSDSHSVLLAVCKLILVALRGVEIYRRNGVRYVSLLPQIRTFAFFAHMKGNYPNILEYSQVRPVLLYD